MAKPVESKPAVELEPKRGVSRRTFLKGTAAIGASAALPGMAQGKQIVIRDAGGLWSEAAQAAYYDPFFKETGIKVVLATSGPDPISQIKSIVDAKSYLWDCANITSPAVSLLGTGGYLQDIDWSGSDMAELIPNARGKWFMGINVFATVLGYRTDTVKKAPQNWADFFDVKGYPGRRGMRKSPVDTLEQALLADGVAPDKLYPLDLDRAYKKLDTIRDSVSLWWSAAAQSSQALSTGEVDMCGAWNSRVQTAINDKVPAAMMWNQALYSVEGWVILKGTPRAELVQRFVQFCANPQRQAEYVKRVPFGPTNPNAYKYLSESEANRLPTAPSQFSKMIYQDAAYWSENQDKLTASFNAWLLKK